jgi:hypothetical protein
MRWDETRWLLLLLGLAACKDARNTAGRPAADTLDATEYIPRDSVDSALNAPRLVAGAPSSSFGYAGDT